MKPSSARQRLRTALVTSAATAGDAVVRLPAHARARAAARPTTIAVGVERRQRRTPSTAAAPASAPVVPTLKRIGTAIRDMELPAVEKISEEQAGTPFHVLVSTMLSAQTRDAITLEASTRLFKRAPTPRAILTLSTTEVEQLIYPVSFYRNKAVHVQQTCELLLSRFGGRVPDTMEELLTLPGVGRKTANLVRIIAHEKPDSICVDTHVHRIANRLGWIQTRTPEQSEIALYAVAPKRWWSIINLYLVTWGQQVCKPVYPLCGRCVLRDMCPKIGVTRQGREA
jgi:endonuclease-3